MTLEWRAPATRQGWLWVPLMVLVAAPWPGLFFAPLPERAVPIFWLLLAGAALLLMRIARASVPFALLLGWALLRALWMGVEIDLMSLRANVVVMDAARARPFQVLLLACLVGLLYAAARELSRPVARWVAWALVAGVAYEGLFGALNLAGRWLPLSIAYPWMSFVVPDQVGRPMGFLTHPNYWGSYMALGLPVLATLGGALPALLVYGMIAASYSGGPIVSASAGALVVLWPELGRRARYAAVALASATVAGALTVHEWRLSGRWEVWQAAWPELARYPIIGQGLGSWRIWADQFNQKMTLQTGQPSAWATLQAHAEPYQLWFELGLIGLGLAGLWAWQAWTSAREAWRFCPAGSGAWWVPGRIPLERAWLAVLAVAAVNALVSPTFHLPAQAAVVLFALARTQAGAAEARALRAALPEPKARRKRRELQEA